VRTLFALVLAAVLLASGAEPADAQDLPREFRGYYRQMTPVVVVRGLTLADLPELAPNGAVGLLVPSAGPQTSAALSFAGIVRGVLHNARLGPRPNGPVLIHVDKSRVIPMTKNTIVLGLPPDQATRNDRRYPIAVFGSCRGILQSTLTRVPGLVSAADIARTALLSPHRLTCRRDGNAVATLQRLERRVEVARGATMPALVIVVSVVGGLALLVPAAALSALLIALLVNLGLGLYDGGGVILRLALLAACAFFGGVAARRLVARPTAVGLALTGVVAAYAVTMAAWPWALSLGPLGPELTSRFYGVSNLLESLLLAPVLVGTALLARRWGWWCFAATAALAVATVSENRLGDDGGGALVLAAAFAVLAVLRAGGGLRRLALALPVAGLAVLVLLNIDAAVSGPDHLRGALAGGIPGLAAVVGHRIPLSYARVAEQWYVMFPLGLFTVLVLRSGARSLGRDRRAVVYALGMAMLASLLVNDSPGPVTLGGLAALFAADPHALRHELALLARRLVPPKPAVAPDL
jgi:hypothetical protein